MARTLASSRTVSLARNNLLFFGGTQALGGSTQPYHYVKVNDAPSISVGNNDSYSLSFSILRVGNGDKSASEKWGDAGTDRYPWACRTIGGIAFNIYDGTNNPGVGDTGVIDATWHNVVCVRDFDNDLVQIYVDGTFHSQNTDTTTGDVSTNKNLYIGARSSNFGSFWGSLKKFALYSGALTSQEVTDLNNGIQPDNTCLFNLPLLDYSGTPKNTDGNNLTITLVGARWGGDVTRTLATNRILIN